jgi:hypothetical protein
MVLLHIMKRMLQVHECFSSSVVSVQNSRSTEKHACTKWRASETAYPSSDRLPGVLPRLPIAAVTGPGATAAAAVGFEPQTHLQQRRSRRTPPALTRISIPSARRPFARRRDAHHMHCRRVSDRRSRDV